MVVDVVVVEGLFCVFAVRDTGAVVVVDVVAESPELIEVFGTCKEEKKQITMLFYVINF